MTQPHDMRVGDAERAAAAVRLSAHAAAGRLTMVELEERLAAANAAVHGRDLAALEADLPGQPAPAPRRPPAVRPPLWPVLPVLLVALAIAASVAVGHPVGFPLLLAFVLWRFARGGPRRRAFGP
ncbi:MAG: DUF1707 domain-containing protein [Solirubrobacteraceae bacterium]